MQFFMATNNKNANFDPNTVKFFFATAIVAVAYSAGLINGMVLWIALIVLLGVVLKNEPEIMSQLKGLGI